MKTLFIWGLIFLAAVSCNVPEKGNPDYGIIPVPALLEPREGAFLLNPSTTVMTNSRDYNSRRIAGQLVINLTRATGWSLRVEQFEPGPENAIVLVEEPELLDELGEEGYFFESGSSGVVIRAATGAGIFYGVQTLFQLLPPEVYGTERAPEGVEWKVPALFIRDEPEFEWRGMHLDVSRHFFPVEFIKRYIDLIAMHKMNVFHWHLTDDNGWRIEIMRYPRLQEFSAWRVDREDQPWRERTPPQPGEKATYGGYYTQFEIESIIRYAKERFITVVPEIEMPGHSSEVFAAYPELSCRGERLYVQPGSYWPNVDIFCAGKEETFEFIENVLLEVTTIFPSAYVHVGGDEADKTRWKECPHCQKRMEDEGLPDVDELQGYFIRRVERYLKSQGKKLIGWDEIIEGGLPKDATVMSWRGFEGGIEAARLGHDVVMCPTSHCYFDYYQDDPETQPEAIGGFTPLEKVYEFDPIPDNLEAELHKHILGGQGNLWTEFVTTPEHAEYMVLPRMSALAEVLWSKEGHHNFNDFRNRLRSQFKRFDSMGANYYDRLP